MDINVALTLPSGFRLNASLNAQKQTQVLGLTGPSGAGKSSLLKVVANLQQAEVCNVDWHREVNRVGLVFQDALLFPHLNVAKNLALAERYAQISPERDSIIDGCVCRHLLDRDVQSLSGGERQRVALARALLNAPDVLMTDEAFSAMDQQLALEVQHFVKRHCIAHRILLVMVSHDVKSLALLCDEVAVMEQGSVVSSGRPESVLFQYGAKELNKHIPFAVMQGRLTDTGDSGGLAVIRCEEQNIYCRQPLLEDGVGKIAIDAQDVSIDLSLHHQSSILNAFECEIRALETVNETQALVTLERGATSLYALISTLSVERLKLTIGMTVTARFKLR